MVLKEAGHCRDRYVSGKLYMFGDNQSVIHSSTLPHLPLNKRHNALAYHRVREAIAAGILRFIKIDGKDNPADVLSKHCGHPQMWPLIQPLLFRWGVSVGQEEMESAKKDEEVKGTPSTQLRGVTGKEQDRSYMVPEDKV